MAKARPVRLCDTSLRDAHQSLFATRMKTEDMVPILEKLDSVGYYSLEMWGGATFDTCMRYLNEDPWERLWTIRKHVKNTKLQMLLRGQNLLGYRNYPDDVVEEFVKRMVDGGIDIVRIFDALNDVRNMETAIRATKAAGAHAQGTVVYTISPVHDIPLYVRMAKDLVELGVDSICIKDMAGLLTPYAAYELVTELKKAVNVPIQLHCHYTSGMASMTYLKAIEAGVDVVDTASSPLALGTSQPPAESIVATLAGTERDTGLSLELLSEIADYWREIKKKYDQFAAIASGVDTNVLSYQIPGGMISNLAAQLKQQGALDKYRECLAEVPRVRKELGYPPLVTPTSQIVGTQAVFNVLLGERYKVVPTEVKNYVLGYYGRPPAPIDEEVKKKIIGDEQPITCRPADLLEPGLEKAKQAIAAYIQKPEDVLSYALFPQVAERFLKERLAAKTGVDYNIAEAAAAEAPRPYYPA
ncbi:MAG: pyruvate carboxylase subunit [Bacillota bacterium]|nr:pyruvate carboxylase subunit [Bacillota bacterium]MDK2882217.1 pyruvate carboxylase subunit [Bacillota bacterium]MDK2959937.1 pyruvate carboxylase subunit [Bacillota bacterium]